MENSPCIDDFPIKTSIYKGFSMAMLNNQMVYFTFVFLLYIIYIIYTYTCVFQCMQNYCLFRNYCWRHFFLPPNRFCMFLMLHMFAGFETAKKPNETAKKPDETANKNQEPKMWKLKRRKNWKQRKFRQPAIIIAVSDFER